MTWILMPIYGCRVNSGCEKKIADQLVEWFRKKAKMPRSSVSVPRAPNFSDIPPAPGRATDDWFIEELLFAKWVLRLEYSEKVLQELLTLFRHNTDHPRMEPMLEVCWPYNGSVDIIHNIQSYRAQVHSRGFTVHFNPDKVPASWSDSMATFQRLSQAWDLEDHFQIDGERFSFEPKRFDTPEGQFFAPMKEKSVERTAMLKIDSVETAERYFDSAMEAAIESVGEPAMVELSFKAFSNYVSEGAKVCDSIASHWQISMIGTLQVEDSFEHPGYETVFPYRWCDRFVSDLPPRELKDKLCDRFLEFQVSIEHTADGESHLLLHTNHPLEWLQEGLEELGLADQSAHLEPSEIYTDLNTVLR